MVKHLNKQYNYEVFKIYEILTKTECDSSENWNFTRNPLLGTR